MNGLLAEPFLADLGRTLLHALWEGSVLGLLAWAGLALLRRRSPDARHRFASCCLGAMVLAPLATFLLLARAGAGTANGLEGAFPGLRAEAAGASTALPGFVPWLGLAWALGAAAMLLRLGGGLWWLDRYLVAPSRPATAPWQDAVARLAQRLGIRGQVRVRVSTSADSPLVIGWLRPLILVPAGAFLQLTPEALEAVLAHELAHVARLDYLANLLQSIAEALLFFHPAVWWLSGHLRDLREHCCDDAAAALCGDPMALAEGLAALARLRRTFSTNQEPVPGLVLGAAQGNLMLRISRLFQPKDASVPSFRGPASALCAVALLGAATLAAQTSKGRPAPRVAADGVAQCDFSKVKVVDQPAAPDYPAEAKARRIQGVVVVAVTMDEQGRPEKVEAVSGPEELRATATAYARSWTFAPLKVKGKAVKARFNLTMPFKLR